MRRSGFDVFLGETMDFPNATDGDSILRGKLLVVNRELALAGNALLQNSHLRIAIGDCLEVGIMEERSDITRCETKRFRTKNEFFGTESCGWLGHQKKGSEIRWDNWHDRSESPRR
jgi:hypothetical protein